MNILIIGGAGLIGGILQRLLSEDGHKVVILDTFARNSVGVKDITGETITGSGCSLSTMTRVFSTFSPEVVFHFADEVTNLEGLYDFQKETDVCVGTATNICRCAELYKVKHVFLGSSGEVYVGGSAKKLNERAKTEAFSYTGTTKLYVESMLSLLSKSAKFSFTALRFFQVFGNRLFINPKHDVLSLYVDSIVKDYNIAISGPATAIDILSADDAARAAYLVFSATLNGSKIDAINIGSGVPVKLIDLYNMVSIKHTGTKKDVFKFAAGRQTRSLVADVSLLSSLGWEPKVLLTDSTLDALLNFRARVNNGNST